MRTNRKLSQRGSSTTCMRMAKHHLVLSIVTGIFQLDQQPTPSMMMTELKHQCMGIRSTTALKGGRHRKCETLKLAWDFNSSRETSTTRVSLYLLASTMSLYSLDSTCRCFTFLGRVCAYTLYKQQWVWPSALPVHCFIVTTNLVWK